MNCHQYEIRVKNLEEDLREAGFTKEHAAFFTVADFEFSFVPADDKAACADISKFIIRHEWLGKMPTQPTHRFVARHKETGLMAGVIVMATPNAFSHLLGKENKSLEKLISRGACISWSPKTLGSWLVMSSIRWMVKNTEFRIFTAYSDPEACELGTIYQACNFMYLGKSHGSTFSCLDKNNSTKGWFSDRQFRKVGQFKAYAKQLGIAWSDLWNIKCAMLWDNLPPDIKAQLLQASKDHQNSCFERKLDTKHKYAHILGKDKKETRSLRQKFAELNPDKITLPYPTIRGE